MCGYPFTYGCGATCIMQCPHTVAFFCVHDASRPLSAAKHASASLRSLGSSNKLRPTLPGDYILLFEPQQQNMRAAR